MGQHDKSKILGTIFNVQKDLTFFHVQMLSLLLQAAWFFIAFYVSGEDIALVSAGDQIAKVVLWYLPLLMEFAFHLFYPSLAGSTPVKPSKIFKRSAITFTVVIGGGILVSTHYVLVASLTVMSSRTRPYYTRLTIHSWNLDPYDDCCWNLNQRLSCLCCAVCHLFWHRARPYSR